MEWVISILSVMGFNGILLYFIKRYFGKRDRKEEKTNEDREELYRQVRIGLETIRLLAYARMSQEIERPATNTFRMPAGSSARSGMPCDSPGP